MELLLKKKTLCYVYDVYVIEYVCIKLNNLYNILLFANLNLIFNHFLLTSYLSHKKIACRKNYFLAVKIVFCTILLFLF
jgi:hypothetical protein